MQDEPVVPVAEPKEKKQTNASGNKKEENLDPQVPHKEKISQIIGIFSLLTAFFLLVAIISFFFNWFSGHADDIYSNADFTRILKDKTMEANNLGGRLGAASSNFLVKQGFGIGALFIPIWLFVLGIRLSLKHKIISLGPGMGFMLTAMAWLSVTLGFMFRNSVLSILGGVVGFESSLFLEGLLGKMGLMLLLLFILAIFLVILYNFSLHKIKAWLGNRNKISEATDEAIKNQNPEFTVSTRNSAQELPVDKYNTVEYAVNEHEHAANSEKAAYTPALQNNGNEQAENTQFETINLPKIKPQLNTQVEFTV